MKYLLLISVILVSMFITSCQDKDYFFGAGGSSVDYGEIYDSNLELEITKDISLVTGGTSRTYMSKFADNWTFEPTRQEFDAYLKLLLSDELEIYGFHNCSHPILDSPEEQNILWNGETYRLNHDSRTEIGVKYKW